MDHSLSVKGLRAYRGGGRLRTLGSSQSGSGARAGIVRTRVGIGAAAVSFAWLGTTFGRGFEGVGLPGGPFVFGTMAMLIATAGLQVLTRSSPRRSVPSEGQALIGLVVALGGMKVLLSGSSGVELRFYAELLMLVVLPVPIAILSQRLDLNRKVAKTLALVGVVLASLVVRSIIRGGPIAQRLDVEQVFGTGLAINQLGHGFAMCSVAAAFLALRTRRGLRAIAWWACAATSLGAVIATGSRGSVLGATLGLVVLLAVDRSRQAARQRILVTAGVIMIVGAVGWLMTGGADERLFGRFSVARLIEGAQARRMRFALAAEGRHDWWETFLGASGAIYKPLQARADPVSELLDPHNVLSSAFVFAGPFVGAMVTLVLGLAFWKAWQIGVKGRSLDDWVPLAFLMPAVVYSLSSGRLTRALSIWIIVGIIWGQYHLRVKRQPDAEP